MMRQTLLCIGLFLAGLAAAARAQEGAVPFAWRDDIGDTTQLAAVHLLAKSVWPARVTINGDSCHLYRTGIFFKKVTLQPGINRVEATVQPAGGETQRFVRTLLRTRPVERPALPLWIDSTSVLPAESRLLQKGDRVRLGFIGAKGHKAWVELKPAKLRLYLRSTDFSDYSRYETDLPLARLPEGQEQSLHFTLRNTTHGQKKSTLRLTASATLKVQAADTFPLLIVRREGALLNQSLGSVRLGPPVIAELPQGVVLTSSGRIGESWRIRLDDHDEGYIASEDVESLPEPALAPFYYLTTLSAAPGSGADVITIPWLQPVPFALFPDPAANALHIRLYGVRSASTWITHRENLRMADHLTWEQRAPETYEITVHLQRPQLWGYTLRPTGAALELRLKYPPAATLKVAIEAGHGGSNLGAVGLSGLEEKEVNLDVARRLEQLCRAAGMQVVQVREADLDMSLAEKKSKIEASDADLLVCIHANSGGTANGYLGANGTSTYYNNPFWGGFARMVYRRLLELPLQEFGCVGSFNYRIIRMTSRPAILVELAFMSHAEDEEKLFAAEFRQQLAEKILAGIGDFAAINGR
ncbi:MAG TPA: N-acetylmuramoyl-L-alanine amidase [bacterium]|nr:N-acetylmuramoyl-L-alanine amidase [bacterium]HQI48984.1 N-acetylmuramoyl-L-alanine amidase [bacterium]HQJ63848.1 N-acetylmuramoyl-L-alanine amidase [bacterium]